MSSLVSEFLSGSYAPHGYCLLWQPELVWTHVVSDGLIALSYFSIPLALVSLLRRRPDVEFGKVIWLFAVFILACGSTHIMSIWNLWHGNYGLEAAIKAITAAASVTTALILWPLIPRVVAIPSPSQLQQANLELAASVGERDAALARLTAEIAQRERAEAALLQAQKIDAVGQLTGGIAHDFNNLLQAVKGNVELILQRAGDTDRVIRWAQNAQKGIERGTSLTAQLLAFSRTQRLELIAIDVNRVVAGVEELIARSLGPSINFSLHLGDEPGVVAADPTQLELAILNLAINARDAMPDGGDLTISTRRIVRDDAHGDLPAGPYVEIAVTDTGIGMPPDIAERALEPFFTTKDVGAGTGLGLSMAYGVAKQSGGTLEIDTRPGAGTTVAILLRVQADRADVPFAGGGDTSDTVPGPARPDMRIMVVDDDDAVRGFICEALTLIGYACTPIASPMDALEAIRQDPPDVLVLDFAMPQLNGAELARSVRAILPELRIVFVTGFADSAALDAVMDSRMAVLRKPFDAGALARLVAGDQPRAGG